MSDIASYDLSRNVNLIELHLGSNNVAEKLDLSKNTKLETLAVCGNFDLTTLDVSNNPGLKHLNISDTDIWSIDVIDCPYIVKRSKMEKKVKALLQTASIALYSMNTAKMRLPCSSHSMKEQR